MNVICLEESAFYALIDKVVEYVRTNEAEHRNKWITDVEAMRRLKIKSKSTLQKLRDEGKIRFSQHLRKNILYDLDSIHEYLEKHAKDTF